MKSIMSSAAYSPLHSESYSHPSLRYGSFSSKKDGEEYDVDNEGNVGVIIDGYTAVCLFRHPLSVSLSCLCLYRDLVSTLMMSQMSS
jgi:hypothetical protein